MITHTISVVELLWTIIALIGLYLCGRLLILSLSDVQWLKENELNGLRQHAAISSVFIYLTMSMTQFSFMLIGIIAMILPSPNNHVQPFTYVITGVFISMSVFKSIMALLINHRRDELRLMLMKERDGNVLPT